MSTNIGGSSSVSSSDLPARLQQFAPGSSTTTLTTGHTDQRNDLRSIITQIEAENPALLVADDLRNDIRSITRKMRELETPETRASEATGSARIQSFSRLPESGITLVAVRNSSTSKAGPSFGRSSASDVKPLQTGRVSYDSYRPSSESKSCSRSRSRSRDSGRHYRVRSRSNERSWTRSGRRSDSRCRGRARSRSVDRSRDRDRARDRGTSSRHRSRSRVRYQSRSRDRYWSRGRSRSRDR